MGKGDRKSKKGKIFMGSFGNTRRRKKKTRKFVVQKSAAKPVALPEVPVTSAVSNVESSAAETSKPKVKRAPVKKKAVEKKEPKATVKKTVKKKEE